MDEGISKKIVSFGNNNEKHGNMKYNKFPNFFHTFASDLLNGLLEHDYKKDLNIKIVLIRIFLIVTFATKK